MDMANINPKCPRMNGLMRIYYVCMATYNKFQERSTDQGVKEAFLDANFMWNADEYVSGICGKIYVLHLNKFFIL